jgi:hypothetical protein
MNKKITLTQAKQIGNKLKINFDVVDPKEWQYAMQVELEHGTHNKRTNVTGNDLLKTGKIALAHLLEIPDYYVRLKKMEEQANKYWMNKKKVSILKK